MNREETGGLVAVMLASCPGQASKFTEGMVKAMINAYSTLLGDLTYEQCNAAVTVLLQTRSWMPSVADIRAAAIDLERGSVGLGGDAWGSVLRAMKEKGAYKSPGVDFVFNDPTTARCVSSLGWRELCLSENTVADRARFIELYDKLASEGRREAQSPALAAARVQRELAAANEIGKLIALVASKELP